MKTKTEPAQIWQEYQQGVQYKTALNLYDNVERNNNFFNDKQWEGVKAPDLDKPVFNILKPVVNYYIAMLISDDIAVNVEVNRGVAGVIDMTRQTPYSQMASETPQMPPVLPVVQLPGARLGVSTQTFGMDEIVPKVISAEVEQVLEGANVKYKNRRMIRNCAVDGDACFYMWFDPDAETGFDYTGAIKVDLIDNTNVYFGNPSEQDAQEQPYIIIAYRRLTEEVREEAKANGLPADEITAYSRSSVRVWLKQNGGFELVDEKTADIFGMDDVDFTRFTFNTDRDVGVISTKVKAKRIITTQIRLENDAPREAFGITGVTLYYDLKSKKVR